DKAGNYTYCTGSVDINPITSSNLSFTCSLVDPHLANVGYAIQARTKIKNDDANVYNDFIFAKLYKYTLAGAVKRVEMQQIGLDLSGGASISKNFLFKGLEPGRYYVTLQYYNYNSLKLGVKSRDFQVGLGDVNGDGVVSSVDVTALYNYLLNNDDSAIVNGDLDGDGVITAGDIVIIYNILLGQ
ncbi:MAG: dockerin type I repeat-containing protein, partial [Muribaculaceae bacterium]|nr:dockerin type I repeat-containing protein [Muribaculaceae bacterium]